jgi:hypothetical protein
MARPKNRSEGQQLTLTLPGDAHSYLVYLATNGKLGTTENEVAAHILIREIVNLQAAKFHEIRTPTS